jgi:transposase
MVALDRPSGRQQRWAYPLLLVVSGVALGVSGLPAPLYGIYESTWHLSPLATTVVFAVYALAALAAVLVSGRVSDVVGRKPVLLGALFALLVGLGVFLVADNMALLLLARTIHGAAVGSIVVAGAAALLGNLPKADWLLADRGYDADWIRKTLQDRGIKACIPGRKSRKKTVKYDKRRYKRRNRIEIMFGRLKDWRRVATRYDRCPETYLSAIALAATVMFWL